MPVKLKKAPLPKFTERFLPRDKATERHFLLLSPFFESGQETGHGHEDRVEHFTPCKSISKRNFSSAFSYLPVGMFLRLILPAPHFGTTKMSGSELLQLVGGLTPTAQCWLLKGFPRLAYTQMCWSSKPMNKV